MPKLIAFVVIFVCLTVAGTLWALSRAPVSVTDLQLAVAAMPVAMLILLAALCLGIYAADVLRYRSLGEAVHARVGWRAGLDASVANFLFSWVTPGATFGAPATIYMLGRRGVPWDAAVVIAFGKAFTGVAVIVAASLVFLGLGLGPDYDAGVLAVVIFGGTMFALIFGLLILAAMRPVGARRVVAACYAWLGRRLGQGRVLSSFERVTVSSIDRLVQLHAGGVRPLAHLALTHIIYFAVFAGVGVTLLHGFGGEVDFRAFAAVVIYIAFTYLAPTPGGAGFAEAMAIPFFGPLLPPSQAVMFVLCFRGLTLYLQLGVGIPYLLLVGGGSQIAARAARGRTDRAD